MASERNGPTATRGRRDGSRSTHTSRRFPLLTALVCMALLGLPGLGQSDPHSPAEGKEEILFREIPLVFGASRYDQKVTEAPSSVTLVTADEIKRSGARTLADVLGRATGLFVTYDRNYSYLGFRGFNRPGDFNSRVLLLVDGHRLNDNLYDQGGLGTESLIDVDLIERIEIIRGPSSSLYGTNAFLGVVNVITRRGRDVQGTELSGEVGSHRSYKGRVTYGSKFADGLEVLLSGAYYDSHGRSNLYYDEFNDPTTNYGVAEDADDDQFPTAFVKMSYRDFTLQGGYVSREKGIPTASYGTAFNTDETRSTDEHAYINLGFDHVLENDLRVTARLYYDHFYYQGDYFYDSPTPVLNRDKSVGDGFGTEIKFDKTILERHKLTVGAGYQDNYRQDLENADTSPDVLYLDAKEDSNNWAIFLQDEYSILDNLLLNAGVRYDYYDSFGGTVNPRLALIYNLHDTTLKALYGQAFRAPNAYEQFYIGTGFKASSNLDPETISTYELVIEQHLADRLRASLSAYYYKSRNLISQVTDPIDGFLVFENADNIGARGLELELDLEGQWPFDLDGTLSYAIQRTEDLETRERLTNSPQHLAKLTLGAPVFWDKAFASFDIQYVSERKVPAGGTTGGFSTTNVALFSQHLVDGVEISASIYNLFDKRYGDPGSGEHRQSVIEQDGRSYWLKIKYGF